MKKRMLTGLLLSAVLVFSGCAGNQEAPRGTVEPKAAASTQEEEDEAQAAETADAGDTADAGEDVAALDAEFDTGSITGGLYRNDFFHVEWEIGDNWYVFNEDEIAQLMAVTQDAFSDVKEVQNTLESGGTFYDLYAQDIEGRGSVNVVLSKLGITERLLASTDKQGYFELMEKQFPEMLAGTPAEGAKISVDTTTFFGEETPCLLWEMTQATPSGDVDVFQKQVVLVEGSYSMTITVASHIEDTTDETLAEFARAE